MSVQAETAPFSPTNAAQSPASLGASITHHRQRTRNRLPKKSSLSNQVHPPQGDVSTGGITASTLVLPDGSSRAGGGLAAPGTTSGRPRRERARNPKNPVIFSNSDGALDKAGGDSGDNDHSGRGPRPQRSRKNFGTRLTTEGASGSNTTVGRTSIARISTADLDLTSRLIHSFTHKADALDCPICFNSIHPAQPIWSCSLSETVDTCCWTTFHLKCIRSWAQKSTKETRDAYRARNEDREGEWRCPGCQTKRHEVPQSYKCFCGRVEDPKAGRLATPHSCAENCVRPRSCEHPCSVLCHPGPCPPCLLSVEKQCYCGQEILVMRCTRLHSSLEQPLTCGRTCNKLLPCGKHTCQQECHPGSCGECTETERVHCYCGKDTKTVKCGDGDAKISLIFEDGRPQEWEGRFQCGNLCERPFACGIHACSKTCHPPSPTPALCPRDPSVVNTCPCGKQTIASFPSGHRTKCTDDIPLCTSTCGKVHATCSHGCLSTCHLGPCKPCTVPISVSCRCGETVRYISCSARRLALEAGEGEILCNTKCTGMRHCGRHTCVRVCCPLAGQQRKIGKGKKRGFDPTALQVEDLEGWHACDLTCNKHLACGNHLCSESDHRGPCPPCLQSTFDEMICNCGRTILEPPVPCGTKIECSYPCVRPPPPCGHGKSPHSCHEDGDCPPCPFLTSKVCACGKTSVSNIRCSQEKVSCGKPCGKLMDCGFHQCNRLCHSGDCGSCVQLCGKPRKLCHPQQHGCVQLCHAPSACPEDEPCRAVVTLHCECGRLQQPATCGACTANPTSRGSGLFQLKCAQECAAAKRSRTLAEAFGIDVSSSGGGSRGKLFGVTWPEELMVFFRVNRPFASMVEKALNEFVGSDKKVQVVLPHMPLSRREFVHKLAEVYRINAVDVDQEPHRSVQLTKRPDTRIPDPQLSKASSSSIAPGSPASAMSVSPSTRRLGALGELKKSAAIATAGSSPTWGSSTPRNPATTAVSASPTATAPKTASAVVRSNVNGGGPPAATLRPPDSVLGSSSSLGLGAVPSPIVSSSRAPLNASDVPARWDEDT